ncbi:C6 domain-containing protein [Caenorhabditis elegans]|uniref:C6 domain-containing protein n=1 Tax=Caenorhabditis elegans TaxID=6239 RepID=B5U8L3_CAEEL|nr:C6 domain-containing protein [Caenorhabditis elegans]CAR64674.1 C6 domain-containing protein [Caenorhabditis elegans]|eukprot:NP_001129933.1 Uncharacterized protein CELE_R07B1.13 [Caenorhabditis elegans]
MNPLFTSALVVLVLFTKRTHACVATSPGTAPTTAAPTGCQACTLDSVQQIMISLGTKAFTSDTIDNSGTCAIRTSVCNGFSAGSGVLISYNRDAAGVDDGTDTVTSTLVCNDAGQWTKTQNGVTAVITAFECQSTP